MRCRIDKDTLDRLVLYEAHLKRQFQLATDILWNNLSPRQFAEYEELRQAVGLVSELVNLAFALHGREIGLMKPQGKRKPCPLRSDLECLIRNLGKKSGHLSGNKKSMRSQGQVICRA